MSITDAELAALKALMEAATPRPWLQWFDTQQHLCWIDGEVAGEIRGIAVVGDPTHARNPQKREDAALIVAAVNVLPQLIADLQNARAEIKRLRAIESAAHLWKSYGFNSGFPELRDDLDNLLDKKAK